VASDPEALTPLSEVQDLVLAHCKPLAPEDVPLDEAVGCVLAADVVAAENVPAFPNTAMDGFAVRASDTAGAPVDLEVIGVLAAGAAPSVPVGEGQAMQIMTGAPMPKGADGIAIVERTEAAEASPEGTRRVRVLDSVEAGMHVRLPGSDLRAGSVVARSGALLTPELIGVIASTGAATVLAHRRPRVGVMATGDELVEVGPASLAPGQIRDSNRHALLARLLADGFRAVDLGIVPDREEAVRLAVEGAVETCDAVLTTGGVSMGEFDYVKVVLDSLAASSPGKALSHQLSVAIRPAKPLSLAFLPRGDSTVAVFGLPGNPVSSLVSYLVIARVGLRALGGFLGRPATIRAVASEGLTRRPGDGKLHLVRVRVESAEDGRLIASSAGGQMSHQLGAMAAANALAFLPDGRGAEPGEHVEVLLFGAFD
jgi:molybdopterin molybdotransferase